MLQISCSKAHAEASGEGGWEGTYIHLAYSLLNFLLHHAPEDRL